MPNIYVFSSSDTTNIWAGIGARKWAVSEKQANNASIRTKSKSLPIGALGIIYCVEEKCLTTPFVVTSAVDQAKQVERIWPQKWLLPFGIAPLGTPNKTLPVDSLSSVLPTLQDTKKNWNQLFYVTPTMVFTASKLLDADWTIVSAVLLE